MGALEGEGGGHREIQVAEVLGGEAVLEVGEQVVAIVTCLVHIVFQVKFQKVVLPHEE